MYVPCATVAASGYFDPMHIGHLEYLERSKALGDRLVVIVNNDAQARLKKGAPFMPCAERVKLVQALKCVDLAIPSIDQDRTVCQTLAELKPTIFTNGGDQSNDCIPEASVCALHDIRLTDGLGAKIQSSSWLLGTNVRSIEETEKHMTHR